MIAGYWYITALVLLSARKFSENVSKHLEICEIELRSLEIICRLSFTFRGIFRFQFDFTLLSHWHSRSQDGEAGAIVAAPGLQPRAGDGPALPALRRAQQERPPVRGSLISLNL